MGIKADLETTGADEKPFYLETGTYTSTCRKIEANKSKNGPRALFKFFWVPTAEQMKGSGAVPLEYPQYEDELDGNIARDWKIICYLLGKPAKADKGVPTWTGAILQWNGKLGGDQIIVGECDVTLKTTPPNPKQKGGGFWDAKYKIEDYDPPGSHAESAAEGLAACLTDVPEESEDDAAARVITEPSAPSRRGASKK